MRRLAVLVAILLVPLVAACGDDTGAVITDAGPPQPVEISPLRADPEPYLREAVRISGTVTRVLPARADLQAFFVDGLLVVAPPAPEDVARGDEVTLEGTFYRLEADDPPLVGVGGAADEILSRYEGDPAVFATTVEA